MNEGDHGGTEERLGKRSGCEAALGVVGRILRSVVLADLAQIFETFFPAHAIKFAAGRLAPLARFGHGIKDFCLGFHR